MLWSLSVLFFACAVAGVMGASAPGGVANRAARIMVTPDESSPGKTSSTEIRISLSPRTAAPARLAVYVPQGYRLNSATRVGTEIGSVSLDVFTDSHSFGFPDFAFGTLTVGNPALGADATAQACSAGPHAAVWIATIEIDERPLMLRIYVDSTTGDEASRGAFRLVTCLPSPYVPLEQGGAPAGAQVVEVRLSLALTNPPAAGPYTWRVVVTPYVYGSTTADEPSTFEARTRVLLPHVLTLKAAYQAKTRTLVVTGRLLGLGQPEPGTTVTLFADWLDTPPDVFWDAVLGDAKTRANGTYMLRKPRKRILRADQRAKLMIRVYIFDPVAGPCTAPPIVPGGCVDELVSPPASPEGVEVTIPALSGKR
jgi:hypothetical protein